MEKYNHFKESGTAWMGSIPESWSLLPIKRAITFRSGGAWGDDPGYSEIDMKCMRIADFDYLRGTFQHKEEDEYTVRSYTHNQVNKLILQQGDILFEKSGGGEKTPVGRTVIYDLPYDALYANFMDCIRFNEDLVIPEYAEYYFRALYFKAVTTMYIKQTTGIQNLNLTGLLSEEKIPIIPLETQKSIVSFLNKKCDIVNDAIETAKRSIQDYKELKDSIIAHAVTQGINKSKTLIDTDEDWLGPIPEGWKVSQIRNLFSLRNERNEKPIDEVNLISLYTDKGVIQHSDLKEDEISGNKAVTAEGYKIVKPGDIVVNIILCWMGAVGMCKYDGVTSPAYDIYKPNRDLVMPEYYHYLFRTKRFNGKCFTVGRGIMMMRWRTYSSEFKSIRVPVPSLSEQKQIVDYLDLKCRHIDDLIRQKEKLISEMELYKRSLIFEAVVGKIKIQ